MESYSSEDEALIGLARQLTDAYREARRRKDQDYACDSIAEFLAEFRDAAPSEALLAMFSLPLTAETYPLVDEAQTLLAARGPAVVGLLVKAVLGEAYDPDGWAPERAAETLDQMDPREASLGLAEVLCGRGDDQLKGAAVDVMVALGRLAEPDLVATLDDARGGEWAQAALEQLRYEREHPTDDDGADQDDAGYGGDEEHDDVAADDEDVECEATASYYADGEPVADESATATQTNDSGGVEDAEALASGEDDEAPAGRESPGAEGHGGHGAGQARPDQRVVDEAYDEFLRRFEQGTGGEHSS